MSERALLARFDLVADNPENIPLLRHYIVDLAIRGKLLDKSALDISAPEMLKRIEAKADSLIKQGKLKKQKPLAPINAEELPATYIAHCTFERLGNVANLQKGLTGIQSAMPGKFPLVVTAATRSTCDHFDFDGAAAIVPMVSSTGHGHASLNRLHYQEGKFALGTILCAVFPIDEELVSARFIFEYLTAFKDDLLVSKMNGTANVTLTVGKIAEVPVPIIAPAVQRRVNELMALCDQLQAAQNEREAQRDRLVTASLHRIGTAPATADEAETGNEITTPLPEAARFHLAHLPRLTTRPEHIKQLRQTILNLAVRGRLVPQDPNDETAVELLKRIQAEKARLVKEGKIKKDKPLPQISEEEKPFTQPTGWEWVRMQTAFDVRDGTHDTPKYVECDGVPLITSRNFIDGKISFDDVKLISWSDHNSIKQRSGVDRRDILYSMIGGNIGNQVIVDTDREFSIKNVALFKYYTKKESLPEYLNLFLKTMTIGLQNNAVGGAQPFVSLSLLRNIPFPIPPLAEQHRIVAKVDELMALCDQLEAQLTTTQTDSRRLLEAVLSDALAPVMEETAL